MDEQRCPDPRKEEGRFEIGRQRWSKTSPRDLAMKVAVGGSERWSSWRYCRVDVIGSRNNLAVALSYRTY